MADYRTMYRTHDGHIRVPFADLGMFLRIERVPISVSEARAIENVATFLFSAGILTKRLKGHVDAYKEDTWVAVPIHELFLDTQGFFLFVQQLLEDLALLIRMCLPPAQRHQMPAAFSHMTKRLLKDVLPPDAPLARFLSTERSWLNELKDLRDDILHRTVFRERSATFPDLIDVLRAGGGQPHFRGTNLATYLGGVVVRVFALICLADEYVTSTLLGRYPGTRMQPRTGILLSGGENDLSTEDKVARFGLGTPLCSMDSDSQSALEFFMKAGEDPGA